MRLRFRIVDINSLDGSTRAPEYRGINPNAKVPAVQFDDGRTLFESNAMLLHFARGGRFLPHDAWTLAKTHEWLFFEQYSHEPAIAVRRSLLLYPERAANAAPRRLESLLKRGIDALAVMQTQLQTADWLTGDAPTVADLSLYAYTHIADQGGYDLAAFPAVAAWLRRVAALPGHIDIDWRPSDADAPSGD